MQYQAGYQGGAYIYGAEYEVSGPVDHSHQHNIPCAVCQAYSRTTSLMIPSRYEYPPGWTSTMGTLWLDIMATKVLLNLSV